MPYHDLREFLAQLDSAGEHRRVSAVVDPRLEMTELCDRVLKAGGPALLFLHPRGSGGPEAVRHIRERFGGGREPVRGAFPRPAGWCWAEPQNRTASRQPPCSSGSAP